MHILPRSGPGEKRKGTGLYRRGGARYLRVPSGDLECPALSSQSGGIGRRSGFKIRRLHGRIGSSPISGTSKRGREARRQGGARAAPCLLLIRSAVDTPPAHAPPNRTSEACRRSAAKALSRCALKTGNEHSDPEQNSGGGAGMNGTDEIDDDSQLHCADDAISFRTSDN